MSTEHHGEVHHHRKHNNAQRFETLIQALMVVAVAILAVWLVYGFMNTGSGTPSWMQ
ncbi:hypothetical protein [Phenylobacterium soli]|uniref:hypothetical protein n=1 Tax=Phenylobacterium soli TaxID=2170551 RepID=UPI001402C555|nr:hypothetical protein [Phenylobacterium soli]